MGVLAVLLLAVASRQPRSLGEQSLKWVEPVVERLAPRVRAVLVRASPSLSRFGLGDGKELAASDVGWFAPTPPRRPSLVRLQPVGAKSGLEIKSLFQPIERRMYPVK